MIYFVRKRTRIVRLKQKKEGNMDKKYSWNLKDIFASQESFEKSKQTLNNILGDIQKYQGKLDGGSQKVYECYQYYEKALELYEKLYAYGMLSYHLDMANQEAIKLFKEVEAIGANFSQKTAFIVPEMTKIEDAQLQEWIQDKDLIRYKRILQRILEDKKHILSEREEQLLANYSEVLDASENVYETLTNAEFKYGELVDENGKKVALTDGTYGKFLRSPSVDVRKQAFYLMNGKYSEFQNTITDLYLTRVKEMTITSKVRGYQSSLEQAVLKDEASCKVYEKLVDIVNRNLSVNHDFMKLKKQMLGLNEMYLYDIYRNPFAKKEDNISFEEAKNEVLEALEGLGNEYITTLKQGFENRWIDVFEKPNKRTGAYNLGVYGVHPYVLMNFVNSTHDVSTIAHELGHSMHAYYANQTQNIIDSDYTIMIAEVASTVNEILLAEYRIKKEKDKKRKAELIYELLEMIRATLFVQTMFAEFEKAVHEKIEKGEMLSSEDLNQIYYQLNQKYFGEAVILEEVVKYGWLRIPHFYRGFYVYQYATGISSAIAISRKILAKENGFVEKYIEMLKQGGSKKSLELLKMVEIDLEKSKPYEDAILFYQTKIEELKKIL